MRTYRQPVRLVAISLAVLLADWLLPSAATAQTNQRLAQPERILIQREVNSATPITLTSKLLLRRVRGTQRALEVFELPVGADHEQVLRELRSQPGIKFAVRETRKRIHQNAPDPYYAQQWYLQNGVEPSAMAADLAWNTSSGSNGIVVAVLDTGVRFDHPDLFPSGQQGKLLPGFDFVDNRTMANDGDGWDADPSDPGDWISQADLNRSDNFFDGCGDGPNEDQPVNSSWHGTKVAGMIAARSNNGVGIAGVSWGAYILPVRVMGKCGGRDGDIIDGMRWAAGLPVGGAPLNPYPADIINMSLGSPDVCSIAYQSVIAELTQMGIAVVVSAGNDGNAVNEPANCPEAIAVTGLRHIGTKVGFSSLGLDVDIAAPGGNCVDDPRFFPCRRPLLTTDDTGLTTPGGASYSGALGTSFSAPLVAGALALMRSVNDRLTVDQLRSRLLAGAQPFPVNDEAPMCRVPSGPTDYQLSECNCTTDTCGAGMLNAHTAVQHAQRPIANIAAPASVSAGASLSLDGAASSAACGRTIASYSWSVVSATGTASPVISNDTQAIASVNAPATGSFTLRLTVTDDQGASDSADIVVTPTSATTTSITPLSAPACPVAVVPPASQPIPDPTTPTASPPVPSRSGGGGGGGSLALWFVIALTLVAIARMRTHYLSNSLTSVFKY
jgi:serine protease